MDVLTIRVQDNITKAIERLTKEKGKTRADVVRELMDKAVKREEEKLYLGKYAKREISLRTLAKRLNVSLWKAYELASKVEFPYGKGDLQRDLKLIRGG